MTSLETLFLPWDPHGRKIEQTFPKLSSDLDGYVHVHPQTHRNYCLNDTEVHGENVSSDMSVTSWTLLVNTGRIGFFIYILQPVDVAVLREAVVCITTVENSKSSIAYMLQFQGEEKPLLVERQQGIGPGMEVTFEIKDHTTSFP